MSYFPIVDTLKRYNSQLFQGDLMGGLTVGVMLIPQGMAYALLAGVPPVYGLYTSIFPLIFYAIFGASKRLAVGPVAMVSLLVASGVSQLNVTSPERYLELVILLALLVGLLQCFFGFIKLGYLVNLLSHPVISGFTTGVAFLIGISQLKHLLGLDFHAKGCFETLKKLYENFGDANLVAILISVLSISFILMAKKISKRIPSQLIVVILGILAVTVFSLEQMGIRIIGEIPGTLPSFGLPELSLNSIVLLLPIALTIAIIGFTESYAVAKSLQAKHKESEINPNQELIAMGLANMGGSLFSAFPVAGGFSRTAVNDEAGTRTNIAALFSALLVGLALVFFTQYFYHLPKAILASIIFVAILGLINIKEAKALWSSDKLDFYVFMITVACTLLLSVEKGILFGVLAALLTVLYRLSRPHVAILGRVPGTDTFRNTSRFSNLEISPSTLLLRFDAQLFFGNTERFKNLIMSYIKPEEGIVNIVVEAGGIHYIDSTAAHMLEELHITLKANRVNLYFTQIKGPIRDKFAAYNLFETLGKDSFFLTTADALQSIEGHEIKDLQKYTMQYGKG